MLRRVRFTSSVLLKNNRMLPVRSKIRGKPCRLACDSEIIALISENAASFYLLVELNGIEPMTSCLQSRRSPN